MEINSRLWSTTKDKGCGELQDQKWRNMERSTRVRVPCSQEEFKELVAAAQECCALGMGQQGTGDRATSNRAPPSHFDPASSSQGCEQPVQLEPGEN